MKTKRKFYRINQYITASQVRLIAPGGKQIGIVEKDAALKKAQEEGVDLVEVAPKANPPVCRLIDFKKFRYLEEKKERQAKKHTQKVEVKEVRLRPFISTNDFQVRLKRAQEFLNAGHKLRLVIQFMGRQITHPEFGQKVLDKFIKELEGTAMLEQEPRFEKRLLVAHLSSLKSKGEKAYAQDENKNRR